MSNSIKNEDNRLGFSITVATPDECRVEIVNWLRLQATQFSTQARIANLIRVKKTLLEYAKAYDDAANFINRIKIINKVISKENFNDDVMMINVDGWIKADRFITAIKRRRIDTGEGLKEAKDYVEKRRKELLTE